MRYQLVQFKTGETRWLKVGDQPILGRHEIARIEFDKWCRRNGR